MIGVEHNEPASRQVFPVYTYEPWRRMPTDVTRVSTAAIITWLFDVLRCLVEEVIDI